MGTADGDVAQAAEVAQGDPAAGVDAVVADPEVGGRLGGLRSCLFSARWGRTLL